MVILGFILIIIGTAIIYILSSGDLRSLLGIIILSLGEAYVLDNVYKDKPQALDVYRGNTTLQVTYQDSVAVDSVVVYKKK